MTQPSHAHPPNDVLKWLKDAGAVLEGHFLLSSGLHSRQYVQCAQLFQFPHMTEKLAKVLAKKAPAAQLVVSPALGGLFLGHEVAKALDLRHIFCERDEGKMVLRRNFVIRPGEKVLVVEDVFTTGKSTREVIGVVQKNGGQVVGCLSLVNRSVEDLGFGVPTESLVHLPLVNYHTAECTLCRRGVPLVKPGSRPMAQAPKAIDPKASPKIVREFYG